MKIRVEIRKNTNGESTPSGKATGFGPAIRRFESPIGRKKPTTPWGYPALGRRSRKRNKYSDNLILRRRSK